MTNIEVELPIEQQPPFAMRLSWIEKNCEHDIYKKIFRYVINSREALRMARVIRELAKMGHLLLHTMNEFGQQKYLDILSSDAKEVIDDCTAPRST